MQAMHGQQAAVGPYSLLCDCTHSDMTVFLSLNKILLLLHVFTYVTNMLQTYATNMCYEHLLRTGYEHQLRTGYEHQLRTGYEHQLRTLFMQKVLFLKSVF